MIISKPNIKYSLEEIVGMDIKGKNLVILGNPASGKTRVANMMGKINGLHRVIHTDDYLHLGFQESVYGVLEDVKTSVLPLIVEGMQCFRLLRKCAEQNIDFPHIVIQIEAPRARTEETYRKERDANKIKYLKAFAVSCQSILNDYFALMQGKDMPEWITWKNEY